MTTGAFSALVALSEMQLRSRAPARLCSMVRARETCPSCALCSTGEEAVEMMIAHLEFLDSTVMAFARLKVPIAAKHHTAPVRYVFLVLTNAEESKLAVKMAHAFAAVLVDSRFVTHISDASSAQGLLKVRKESTCHRLTPLHPFPQSETRAWATSQTWPLVPASLHRSERWLSSCCDCCFETNDF